MYIPPVAIVPVMYKIYISGNVICDQKNQMSYITSDFCVFYDSENDYVVATVCPFLFPNSALNDNLFSPIYPKT